MRLPPLLLLLVIVAGLAWLGLRESPRDALLGGKVVRMDFTITPENLARLAENPRGYVPSTLVQPGEGQWEKVGIRLKGNSSFRPISDHRPAFSLRVGREISEQTFHGLDRFQLNNAAQDGTYLNELMGGEMARHAGIPASRCTLVLLSLNGTSRGVYVLKEGFDREFHAPFHRSDEGQLYDGGLHNDIHPGLEQDRGDDKDKTAITEFSEALRDPDPARRLERLERILDIDAYLRHLAVENILVHMDGYSYRANNYRAYHDPATSRFSIVFHGMDNLLGVDAWGQSHVRGYVLSVPGVAPLYPDASATAIAQALWSLPPEAGIRERFRRQAVFVYDRYFRQADWPARAEARAADLARQITALDPAEGKAFEERSREFVRKLRVRMEIVHAQFADVARLATPGSEPAQMGAYFWTSGAEAGSASQGTVGGREAFVLRVAGGRADFRLPLSLAPGVYRLSVPVRASGLRNAAYRIRLSGQDTPAVALPASRDAWSRTEAELTVGPGDTTLVLELRGEVGEVALDAAGMLLSRLR